MLYYCLDSRLHLKFAHFPTLVLFLVQVFFLVQCPHVASSRYVSSVSSSQT